VSAEGVKQGIVDVFIKLLNGAYALPVLIIGIVYLWSNMTLEQIQRVRELEPLLNSSFGIAFSVIVVFSYLSNVISSPIKEMTKALIDLKGKIDEMIDIVQHRLEHAEDQRNEMKGDIKTIQKFFDDRR
jgi:hypothetical protein